jgi:hypothetical protein
MSLLWLPCGVLLVWVTLVVCYARPLAARWREPVLRHPVLVLESDDWGAGPAAQASALRVIADTLVTHRDARGTPAVMTLGLVLACARREPTGLTLETLESPNQSAILDAINAGQSAGVFSAQLHGLTHFEPEVLARCLPEWPSVSDDVWTENLPSRLQSALIDAADLPSRPLAPALLAARAHQALEIWQRLFGRPPAVAVPTTFIWDDAAEVAWSAIGVAVLVTPGQRATARDAAGKPAGVDRHCLNGERSPAGLLQVVRDVYFEPARGHDPQHVALEVDRRVSLGRPALVEIHRDNFCSADRAAHSLARLSDFLAEVRRRHGDIRFTSTATLAAAMAARDPDWVETACKRRWPVVRQRWQEIPRFARLARLSGLAGIFALCGT